MSYRVYTLSAVHLATLLIHTHTPYTIGDSTSATVAFIPISKVNFTAWNLHMFIQRHLILLLLC